MRRKKSKNTGLLESLIAFIIASLFFLVFDIDIAKPVFVVMLSIALLRHIIIPIVKKQRYD